MPIKRGFPGIEDDQLRAGAQSLPGHVGRRGDDETGANDDKKIALPGMLVGKIEVFFRQRLAEIDDAARQMSAANVSSINILLPC